MMKVVYGVACLVVAALPFLITTSRTMLAFAMAFEVLGGMCGYLVHAKEWKKKRVVLSVMYFGLGIIAVIAFTVMMQVLSAEAASGNERIAQLRETLIAWQQLTNIAGGIIMGFSAFFLVSGTTILAEHYSHAFSAIKAEPFSPDIRWLLITLGLSAACFVATLVLLNVPERLAWLRIPIVVLILAAVYFWLHNPQYVYRRVAVALALSWTITPLGGAFLAETPAIDAVEEGPILRTLRVTVGKVFVQLTEVDWSFHICMLVMVLAFLFADYMARRDSMRSSQPTQ